MKKYIVLYNKIKLFIYRKWLNIYNSKNKLLNLNILFFLGLIFYKFIISFNGGPIEILGFIFTICISGLISTFVLDNFKYSDIFVVRILQKIIKFNISLIIIFFVGYYLYDLINFKSFFIYADTTDEINNKMKNKNDLLNINSTDGKNNEFYNFSINKKIADTIVDKATLVASPILSTILPNIGAGAAAGTVGAAALKFSSGLPPLQRAAFVGASTLGSAPTAKLVLDIGAAASKILNIKESIKNSPHADVNIESIPSPEGGFINSVLEASEQINNYTPLEELIIYQFSLNAIILIFILILLIMLFNRFILTTNLEFITSLFDKYTSNKISQWFKNKINKSIDYNNRFTLFLFLFISIILIINVILSLFISSELLLNIDDYVTVYNHLKKN